MSPIFHFAGIELEADKKLSSCSDLELACTQAPFFQNLTYESIPKHICESSKVHLREYQSTFVFNIYI